MSLAQPDPLRKLSAFTGHLLLSLVSFFGCSSPPARAPEAHVQSDGSENRVVAAPLSTTVVTQERTTDVEALLVEAQIELENQRYSEAAHGFEKVVEVAQNPDERLRGLLGWGTSLDLGGQPKAALGVYQRFASEASPGAARDEVQVRQVRLFTFLGDYQRAAEIAAQIKSPQPPLAQVALFSSLALSALAADREQEAELAIGRGRSVIESEHYDHLGSLPRDVAALYFALGELRRKKGEAIVFDPMPSDFLQALESRCQWILDAQSAYSQAMRAKDAHWSAMAGVSVGLLYAELHQELTNMPRPGAADSKERRELFDGALRLRYSILLTKANSMLRATLALRDRDQAQGPWVTRAEETLREIEAAEEKEEQAILALPYTRDQLQQALDDLTQRSQARVGQK